MDTITVMEHNMKRAKYLKITYPNCRILTKRKNKEGWFEVILIRKDNK